MCQSEGGEVVRPMLSLIEHEHGVRYGVVAESLAASKWQDLIEAMLEEAQVAREVVLLFQALSDKVRIAQESQSHVGVQDIEGVGPADVVLFVPSPVALHVGRVRHVTRTQVSVVLGQGPHTGQTALQQSMYGCSVVESSCSAGVSDLEG